MKLTQLAALLLSIALGTAACQSKPAETTTAPDAAAAPVTLLPPGPWRGVLAAQGQEIPFLFEVATEAGRPVVYLINKGLSGEERLRCEEITQAGDSVTIRLHAFDAALVVRADGKDKLKGAWVKYDTKTPYRVPLVAFHTDVQQLFDSEGTKLSIVNKDLINGQKYRVEFTDSEGKKYPAVGILKQVPNSENTITGTFLTSTGDYRYLAGGFPIRQGKRLIMLSTFDGNHAFLFKAQNGPPEPIDITKEYAPNTLFGDFYSGKSGHETWTAIPDPTAKLPDADTLTYLKKGESRLNFKFPSVFEGGSVSPTDAKYRGKVVVVQILGSWCPNCMDETNFLAPWYEKNKARGVEIIGLGYERSPDYAQASERLRKMRERFHIGYDLAVAGVSNKDSAAKSLPQLAKVLAFPTTIFLDKKGNVRRIHTGFAGPGTGKYYQEETASFEREIDKLLKE